MMSDLMREQFEEWQLQTYCGGSERLRKCKNDESYYYYTDVQLKWKAWQASRECLVIELPDSPGHYYNGAPSAATEDPLECWRDGYRKATVRIHAAGVETK